VTLIPGVVVPIDTDVVPSVALVTVNVCAALAPAENVSVDVLRVAPAAVMSMVAPPPVMGALGVTK
jgi:hypothetical protein